MTFAAAFAATATATAKLLPPAGPWPTDVAGAGNPMIGTPFVFNGASATNNAQLLVWFPIGHDRRSAITRTIGDGTIVRGMLRDRSTHRAIRGAVVHVAAQNVQASPWLVVGTARTNRQGLFRAVVVPGSTLRVGVVYWPFVNSPSPVFSRRLLVRARGRVVLKPQISGRSILFRGRVSGAAIPPGGLLVAAQVRNGRTWATVRLLRCFAGGSFRARYRFKFRNRGFLVRAAVPAQVGWPLYGASSKVHRVRTR